MNDKNLFSPVLDKNEEILKVYKPNKTRAWFTIFISMLCFVLFFLPVSIGSAFEPEAWPLTIIMIVCFVLYVVLSVVLVNLWLNKTVYAVTSKRILIRTGYIGVDYISLDYTMLGALTVNVGWIDKLLHKNTGSIAFGSMASPMTNQAGAKFNFSYIKNPYETDKEIKEIIDTHKDK